MPSVKCKLCGDDLPPGSLKYIVQIHITADFDGYISDEDWNDERSLEEIVESLREISSKKAQQDVQQKLAFHLCARCKNNFVRNPLGLGEDGESWVM